MLLAPGSWLPASRCEDVLAALPRADRRTRTRRDARLGARAGQRPAHDRRRRRRAARGAAPGAERHARRARPPRRGRGHAPVGALGAHAGFTGRALPVRAPVDARAGPARADVRAARARRGPRPRGGRTRAERDAAAHPGAARAVGQLAVLAGPRLRPGFRPHAGVPDVPAHRRAPPLRQLRRLRAGDRRARALRRDPRAHVPVVGRAAAADVRHRRGPRDGRPDARGGHRRARRAGAVPRAAGGRAIGGAADRRRGAGGRGREPLHRGPGRDGRGADRPAGVGQNTGGRHAQPACRQVRAGRAGLDCVGELSEVPSLAESPGAERQRAIAARTGSLEGLVEVLADEFVGDFVGYRPTKSATDGSEASTA